MIVKIEVRIRRPHRCAQDTERFEHPVTEPRHHPARPFVCGYKAIPVGCDVEDFQGHDCRPHHWVGVHAPHQCLERVEFV